ncbi:protein sensitive to proton rhizotoxicity 1-like [Trifolium pratense]|uniref:Protein sensitive to proton rhizotoxicity 1-like n=1 Tax=Trifolium pratense TaxID=57577 RepID=A0A2K3N0G4_TRIPR|nr:protein SENSITIVE TO PROTON RHIZOTOXICITY 2-like [Trifolium pratense]PNX96545.1 protein sensitive to proton rhizotoxicity 1-like [Trifolium pratense]
MTTPPSFEIGNQGMQMFPMVIEDLMPLPNSMEGISGSPSNSLLFNLSILKEKFNQVQNLVGVILSPNQQDSSTNSMAISNMNSTIQEIIVTSTSIMFTCQQIALGNFPQGNNSTTCTNQEFQKQQSNNIQSSFGNNNTNIDLRGQSLLDSNNESQALDWFGERYKLEHDIDDQKFGHEISETNNSIKGSNEDILTKNNCDRGDTSLKFGPSNARTGVECGEDIVELDATDLLAKYTHYCQVCGKGFKRDANLRMHMRAHGDEYKSSAALSNPINKSNSDYLMSMKNKKYSCPQEGCRWNQKHAKFQPLKSLICAKNHYKRSHCPKMYVCKRCNLKQFSVLSDLRTHEKHCGDLRWQCSCGTTFSRKDKLIGHVGLFVGHHPVINGLSYSTHTN